VAQLRSVVRLKSDDEVVPLLEQARLRVAYAFGYLQPPLRERTEWFALVEGDQAAWAALSRAYDPPILIVYGPDELLFRLLAEAPIPGTVYLTVLEEHFPAADRVFRLQGGQPMWRMWVNREGFKPVDWSRALRLRPEDTAEINRLYRRGAGSFITSRQVSDGVYYGIWQDDRLVSVAGTHFIDRVHRIAAVGNVFTDPDFRGLGYATAVTGRVTADLLELVDDVVLNVNRSNTPAVRAYRRLGYEAVANLIEGVAERRHIGPFWRLFGRIIPGQEVR
jgi:ribosomal protein S18 acetylase RimI-like enzyme